MNVLAPSSRDLTMGGPSFLTGDLRRGTVPEATTQRSSAREGISQAEARGSRVISSGWGNIDKAQRCETARGIWEAGSNKVRVTCQQERLAVARLCSFRCAQSTAPAASAPPQSLLGMQNPKTLPDLQNGNLHFNKNPR